MEIELVYAESAKTHKIATSLTYTDKLSKLKELISQNLNLTASQCILIDQKSGIDLNQLPSDDQIAPEKRKQVTVYVYNEELRTETDVVDLVQTEGVQPPSETQIELSVMAGLIEKDITQPYSFKNLYTKLGSSGLQYQDQRALETALDKLKSYEATSFANFTQMKNIVREYKVGVRRCARSLDEMENLAFAQSAIMTTTQKTFDEICRIKQLVTSKAASLMGKKEETLKLYKEGIAALKRYELHRGLWKVDNNGGGTPRKQHLIDIYYNENSMNSFRSGCVVQLEKLHLKVDNVEREFKSIQPKVLSNIQQNTMLADDRDSEALLESKSRNLTQKRAKVQENEVLLVSMIHTVYGNLVEMRNYLDKLDSKSDSYLMPDMIDDYYISTLAKQKATHARLLLDSHEHLSEVESLAKELRNLQQSFAVSIFRKKNRIAHSSLLKRVIPLKELKHYNELLDKQEKDFLYLKKPLQVPQAYETSLTEMVRRKQFRKILDADIQKMNSFIAKEQSRRQTFSKDVHTYLPSSFCPQLRDQAPELSLEGAPSEYNFPDLDDVLADVSLSSPFEDQSSKPNGALGKDDNHQNARISELVRKVGELSRELELRQGEYSSNLKEKDIRVQRQEIKLNVKEDQMKELQVKLGTRDSQILKFKKEVEEMGRSHRDLAMQFKVTQYMNEETIARKSKQLETVLKEKKCTNCFICLEEIPGVNKKGVDGGLHKVVSDLNDRLVAKSLNITQLEESVRQSTYLISQITNQNFSLLRQKTGDFLKQQDTLKARYEQRLMEVEDQLGLETQKCTEIIKARVAPLHEKIDKLKKTENNLKREESKLKERLRELTGQVKLKDEQVAFYKKENARKNEEKSEFQTKIQAVKDKQAKNDIQQKTEIQQLKGKVKEAEVETHRAKSEAREQKDVESGRLQREKEALQEQLRVKEKELAAIGAQQVAMKSQLSNEKIERGKELGQMSKQLKELAENSEKEIRAKNDQIKYLEDTQSKTAGASSEAAEEARRVLRGKVHSLESQLDQSGAELVEAKSRYRAQLEKSQSQKQKLDQLKDTLEFNARLKHIVYTFARRSYPADSQPFTKGDKIVKDIESSGNQQDTTGDDFEWETCLLKMLKSSKQECINFRSVNSVVSQLGGATSNQVGLAGDNRLLFMPHSPGIYVALVMKDAKTIENEHLAQITMQEQKLKEKDDTDGLSQMSYFSVQKSEHSALQLATQMSEDATTPRSAAPPVQKLFTQNHLFLDLNSLSKSFQTILKTYTMFVIARVSHINIEKATEENPYGLVPGTLFYQCQIKNIENIVGLGGSTQEDQYGFTNYQCSSEGSSKK